MSVEKIKTLVVDDAAVTRMLLVHLLTSDPRIEVIGAVDNGLAALDFVHARRPDVVLMDIHMPHLDGFETTRMIMEQAPIPIVICTATADPTEVATAFRLLEAGAVACVSKPLGPEHPEFDAATRHLLETVRLMAEVKVVRRWPRSRLTTPVAGRPVSPMRTAGRARLVGVGASTGGPLVLQALLAGLPKDFPLPILIVQHIARGFLPGLVEWLNQTSSLSVQIAAHGAHPLPGHAYVAPDDYHLAVSPSGYLVLAREPPENGLRPAVSYLFRSLAEHCGANAIGILLTGMGKDGAAELKLMKDQGADTIVQDRSSSVVHGMPGEAIALGAATCVLPAERIAQALLTLANGKFAREKSL